MFGGPLAWFASQQVSYALVPWACHGGPLMFTRRAHGRHFVDVSENAFYWYFVVLVWLPLYAVIYWIPRLG